MEDAPTHFIWSNKSMTDFTNHLNTVDCTQQIDRITTQYCYEPNKMVSALTGLLTETANKVIKTTKRKAEVTENPPWFDKSCEEIKNEIKTQGKQIRRDPLTTKISNGTSLYKNENLKN